MFKQKKRQRLAVPVHGLRKRRRRVPHPVPDRFAVHRQAALLFRDGHGSVLELRLRQGLGDRAHPER